MSRMFQIREDDLAMLEADIPRLVDRLTCAPNLLDNAVKTKIRRVQLIITNVRWNYGPPDSVEIIPVRETP